MNKHDADRAEVDHKVILDRIYEIALKPSMLEDFIDLWVDADLATQFSTGEQDSAGAFDTVFKAHLGRAETFLTRGEIAPPDLADHLRPYDDFAAFVVNTSLTIAAANTGAKDSFGLAVGDRFAQFNLPADVQNALAQLAKEVLKHPKGYEQLLKVETQTRKGTILFRVLRIAHTPDNSPAALIVSTHFQWRTAIGGILHSAFGLTHAEQGVVRLLAEGQDAKSIANTRGTSVGTVRTQIKSIISKMNLRSQMDVIRFAVTLGTFSKKTEHDDTAYTHLAPELTRHWLEQEVWKPFKSLTLPDGRTSTYHDMGPADGNPVLTSHLGSCMVRWPKSMIQLAFQNNLRVICPIRPGYGQSQNLTPNADVLETVSTDTMGLLKHLDIPRLPFAVVGTDFAFAATMIEKYPKAISELIGIGARPCLPGGLHIEGEGRWQRFFVWTARHNPNLVRFASKAVMAMCKHNGPESMLRQLCKESPADMALLETDEMMKVLASNISLMAGKTANAGQAFAMEFIAFHQDWSARILATKHMPVQIFIAQEDPTLDITAIPQLQSAYPWMSFQVIPETGLALMYQKPKQLIPILAKAAKHAASARV